MEKDKLISQELKRLKKIFKNIPEGQRKLVDGLIQNAAFMAATLAELQERINDSGAIIRQVNGNGFETTQENPAQKSYNTMIGKYTAVIDKLSALLPDTKADGVSKAGESLAAFVAAGKPRK